MGPNTSRPPGLSPHVFVDAFGPSGVVARASIAAFAAALDARDGSVHPAFARWGRAFRDVYGPSLDRLDGPHAAVLPDLYGLSERPPKRALFAVHTYYALLTKLVLARGTQSVGGQAWFSSELADSARPVLLDALRTLEAGDFVKGDGLPDLRDAAPLGWYVDAFTPEIEETVRGMLRVLAAVEFSMGGDPFTALYMALVPRSLRHSLGEYYTPRWLAEFALDETGYDGRPDKRMLDPACGSGVFLVLAIQRAKEWGARHGWSCAETATAILRSIWGFDLNPLAVLAARANYVFALGEFADKMAGAEIPVYLADSVTNAGAPSVAGKFDFVIGNPPWIRWGYLSQEYRKRTLDLWKQYGLFSLKGASARLGPGEKDFSMLFTYVAADHYLADRGRLGFLITNEVLKSKGAGEGFRRFQLGAKGDCLRVIKAHDLVQVQPFEKAANKTSMIVLQKGAPTTYPLPYVRWKRKPGVGAVPLDATLEEAMQFLTRQHLSARPIGSPTGPWQTTARDQTELSALQGENFYQARLGARVEPYGVFWLEFKEALAGGRISVDNLPECGKRDIPKVTRAVIESDLVYPAVRGADVARWGAAPGIYILLTQDPVRREPYPEHRMKTDWPRTYTYLTRFKETLLSRGSRTVREFAERTEFYAMFGVGPYTVANYKVVWKRMADDVCAAVISQWKTPFGFKTIIPTDTTSLFATDQEDEAHYLCAVINSGPVREFVKSYSSGGRGFGAPSVMKPVAIRRFDPHGPIYKRLADLSKSLHHLKEERSERLSDVERDVDAAVRTVFGIPGSG